MATCKGCGKEIVWGTTAEGKKVPLDPRAPVFAFDENSGDAYTVKSQRGEMMLLVPDPDAPPDDPERIVSATVPGQWMVSHFATCPKANDFSGSKTKDGG